MKGDIKLELLDIVDENGNPTGDIIERTKAHEIGAPHRTSHVWLIRKSSIDTTQILIQKRSNTKDCHPGSYDISSAGHIPAGSDYISSALRELKEELGVDANPNELIFIGFRKDGFEQVFYGKMFKDNQISKVFLLKRDIDERDFILQEEEVSEVLWIDLCECIHKVKHNLIKNCIALDELYMIKNWCENIF